MGRSCFCVVRCDGGRGTLSKYECFHNHAADSLVRSSLDTAPFSLFMPTARRPSSGEIVHMCGQDGFPSFKGHILLAWVLPLSRKNLIF